MKKKVGILLAVFVLGFLVFVVVTFGVIYKGVTGACERAKTSFGGDCRGALEKVLESEEFSFRERNKAIWALGQLANKESLPVLEKYYTGEIENKEPLDRGLSQYELDKAIRWCNGGNVTSWMYNRL